MAGPATLRPDRHHQSPVEVAGGDETGFAVIEPLVRDTRGGAGKHFAAAGEILIAMPEREITLGGIEAIPQINVPPINVKPGNWAVISDTLF